MGAPTFHATATTSSEILVRPQKQGELGWYSDKSTDLATDE